MKNSKLYSLILIFAVALLSIQCTTDPIPGPPGEDGIDGIDGIDGADGFNSLIAFRDIPRGDAVCLGGGTAVQPAVAADWKRITGATILQGYGLTETSPVAICCKLDSDYDGSIGLPVPSTDVMIAGDDGNALPLGDVGEICIKGPQVMEGYWQRPKETAETMLPGGWLRTGDVGRMDEGGYVWIEDRKKDMILVSGFNVYPNEIENVVVELDGILEAAAIGVPDERSGEAVKIFAVRKDDSLTEQDILDYCRDNLTGYKRPKHVEFRDELPKTNVGKILRRALRD